MSASADADLEARVAMAMSALDFAREYPADARLLLMMRPEDLVDAEGGGDLAEAIATRNLPLIERLRTLARELYGADDARSLDAVQRAVVELPYAVCAGTSTAFPPGWPGTSRRGAGAADGLSR